ncbi:MAG: Hsp70 family protein [Rickettsiales bacterium]|nr:Hsp70 family protein [Rickettsiales bacterium]
MPLINISEPIKQEAKHEEIIVGIDLGTTNSLIAIIDKNNKPRFFKNDKGQEIIPSIVNINNVNIASIKRLMGKNFHEAKHQKLEFKIKEGENHSIKVLAGGEELSPEEISAKILKKLKNIAEQTLKTKIEKAVITVPAYFDEGAKNATKLAAKLAGLDALRLVNEPTAGALAYGLENESKGTYVIYDLGGGTFDVSILKMQKGIFRVLGVSGNNQLGGDDFDRAIQENSPNLSLEEAKNIKENALTPDLEKLIFPLIQETISLTINLINDLEINKEDINGVILIGGSTRISLIKQELAKIFGKNKIFDKLDPDKIVAQGAAWQAYNLSGKGSNLLLDVIPLSLGIEMYGGITDKVILRNSTIPTQVTKEFTTQANNQTGMKLHIVQGERELAKNCRSLANFEIKNIPPLPAGKAKVAVTFKVDADGLLTVSAEELSTNQKQEITVKPSYGLDVAQTKEMLLDSLKHSKEDISQRLLIEKITESEQDLELLKKDLENFGYLIAEQEKQHIQNAISKLEEELNKKESREVIKSAHDHMVQTSENLILKKVNLALEKKVGGKNLDEF